MRAVSRRRISVGNTGSLDRQAIVKQSARGSSATFYKWKAKFGGMDVSDARKLKVLEDENAKLKKLQAEQMLDNAMLKDVASRKW